MLYMYMQCPTRNGRTCGPQQCMYYPRSGFSPSSWALVLAFMYCLQPVLIVWNTLIMSHLDTSIYPTFLPPNTITVGGLLPIIVPPMCRLILALPLQCSHSHQFQGFKATARWKWFRCKVRPGCYWYCTDWTHSTTAKVPTSMKAACAASFINFLMAGPARPAVHVNFVSSMDRRTIVAVIPRCFTH